MKKIETLIFGQKDADQVGGIEKLRARYEARGFGLVEIDPETLKDLYTDSEDDAVVLIMDREVPDASATTPRPTAVWPVKNWEPLVLEGAEIPDTESPDDQTIARFI